MSTASNYNELKVARLVDELKTFKSESYNQWLQDKQ